MDFAGLKAAVTSSLARDDFPAHVYDLATAEINARFRIREMDAVAVLTTVKGQPYVKLPDGLATDATPNPFPRPVKIEHAYIGSDGSFAGQGGFSDGFSDGFEITAAVAAGALTPLDSTSERNITREWSGVAGLPRSFAIVGGNLRLGPIPDGAYTVVLSYIGAMPALAANDQTNPILARFPSLYLYSALRHAAVWAQDMELGSYYTAAYESEAARIIKDDRLNRYSGPLEVRVG